METKNNVKEIDTIALVQRILEHKITLAVFIVVFAVIGVVKALYTPREYTTNVILAPELSGGGGLPEGLSNLASMVGVDLSSSSSKSIDAIYPEIYPDVLSSTDFILKLFDVKVKTKGAQEEKTYFNHLVQDVTIPFWSYPQIWIQSYFEKKETGPAKALNPFSLTKAQDMIVKQIRSSVFCSIDKKTSVISISVKDNDPAVSAIMADTVMNRLQQYITVYRTHKSRTDLAYTQKLYDEAKAQYTEARQQYASFSDANTDVILQSYKSKEEDLENDMQLKFNTYTQLSQQLQIAKAKVQEKTPAFTVIQRASIPLKPSGTPRSLIVILTVVVGCIADAVWVLLLRDMIRKKKA